ncbi:patatin-like phospholipase family protein [Citrobacter sp. JGM124]|nr:patatin-like phospholipase family protein [Citrobacter sp. JGM124]
MGHRTPVTIGNIAPLALTPFDSSKIALVCEGGGQRGIFTAGVLDEFMRARFNPFDLLLGTSAGAQNLSAYLCNQRGYARNVIMNYTTRREFFNPLRFVRGGNLIDLDWLIDSTSSQCPLAIPHAEKLFDLGKVFFMCACRSDNYQADYFSPTRDTWLNILKASSAIPGFYRSGVEIGGVNYLDGGISDAIPVREAVRQGADTVVVIRTVPSQVIYPARWLKHMENWFSEGSLQQLLMMAQHHQASYSSIQHYIDNPPDNLRIFEIYPPRALLSSALGSRQTALNIDYKMGRLCGRYFLATVGKLLIDKPPVKRYTAPAGISRAVLEAQVKQEKQVSDSEKNPLIGPGSVTRTPGNEQDLT